MRGEQERDDLHRVINEMNDVAGGHCASGGANGSEHDAHKNQKANLPPSAPQLARRAARPNRVPTITTPAPIPKLRAKTG